MFFTSGSSPRNELCSILETLALCTGCPPVRSAEARQRFDCNGSRWSALDARRDSQLVAARGFAREALGMTCWVRWNVLTLPDLRLLRG
mmetsp:Transcript_57454/g.186633  ORF Transcript_57454/g.186633 Transcript_57454/m.186633 type:complete len:89 (-) Transcript_57454:13-279(-)